MVPVCSFGIKTENSDVIQGLRLQAEPHLCNSFVKREHLYETAMISTV